jgi:hypothetical protein
MKIVLGDMNVQIVQEHEYKPIVFIQIQMMMDQD